MTNLTLEDSQDESNKELSDKEEVQEESETEEDEDEMKTIDVFVEHGVRDPRNNYGTRSRLTFCAILDSGVKLDTVEVFLDRNSHKVVLTGEYISNLMFAKVRMGDMMFASNHYQMESNYQTFLNTKFEKKFKIVGKIPKNIEVENGFVNPESNLPASDPIFPVIVPNVALDGTALEAHVVHFYAPVVQKESNGNSIAPRTRSYYNRRGQQNVPGVYRSPAAVFMAPQVNHPTAATQASFAAQAHSTIPTGFTVRQQAPSQPVQQVPAPQQRVPQAQPVHPQDHVQVPSVQVKIQRNQMLLTMIQRRL